MTCCVRLKVWGDYACFTRPEMKVERVSYDVITPSAARGILEAIYWKPSIRWVIDRLHVLNPVRFTSVKRNELGSKLPAGNVRKAMNDGKSPVRIYIEENRQQRTSLILKDVAYVIEAHFEFTSGEDNNPGKHLDIFTRRAEKGQCFNTPYLGCREFSCSYEPAGNFEQSQISGEIDLGWMLHDMDFSQNNEACFYRAVMKNGVIDVPKLSSGGVMA
jgi:CRISPR-associated protein Cas5d